MTEKSPQWKKKITNKYEYLFSAEDESYEIFLQITNLLLLPMSLNILSLYLYAAQRSAYIYSYVSVCIVHVHVSFLLFTSTIHHSMNHHTSTIASCLRKCTRCECTFCRYHTNNTTIVMRANTVCIIKIVCSQNVALASMCVNFAAFILPTLRCLLD